MNKYKVVKTEHGYWHIVSGFEVVKICETRSAARRIAEYLNAGYKLADIPDKPENSP